MKPTKLADAPGDVSAERAIDAELSELPLSRPSARNMQLRQVQRNGNAPPDGIKCRICSMTGSKLRAATESTTLTQ